MEGFREPNEDFIIQLKAAEMWRDEFRHGK